MYDFAFRSPELFVAAGVLVVVLFIAVRRSQKLPKLPTANALMQVDTDYPFPCFVTDTSGEIIGRNKSADDLNPNVADTQSVQDLLSHMMAEPKSVVFRILSKLNADGWASVQLTTRANRIDVSARKLSGNKVY